MTQPKISALIATAGARPQLLRTTVQSMFDQSYTGEIEVVVVFDYTEIDALDDLVVPENRSLKTVLNHRSKGLAGGRNTGVEVASGQLVGFCDDDDYWYPNRIASQLALWRKHPEAVAISAGITVRSEGKDIERLAPERAQFDDFLLSRIIEINPCTTLFRRADLLATGRIGPVDEHLPAAYGEDYDLLLRATRCGDIYSIQEPGALILWDRPSFFAGRWQAMVDGLTYILQKFPEFENKPRGLARVAGQIAFAHAALGNRQEARAFARSTLRRDPAQLRGWAAYAVAGGLAKPDFLLNLVNKAGRGL